MIIQKIYKEIIITPTRIAHNEGSQGLIIDTKKEKQVYCSCFSIDYQPFG
jgi:hypothetical protein